MIRDRFDIDGHFGPLEGVHDPEHRWNGWACPYFPLVSVYRIAAVTHAENAEREGTAFTIDDQGVWELDLEYAADYPDPRGRLVPTIVHEGATYYAAGESWCWQASSDYTH